MKVTKFLGILIFLVFSVSILAQSKGSQKWSPNLGIMNWHEAKKKCESKKMRLPTLEELKDAYAFKEMQSWKEPHDVIWSSESVNYDESAKAFTISDGTTSTHWKVQPKETAPNMSPPGETTSVRCIQANFQRIARKSGLEWSENFGEMDYASAGKKCQSLKMQLPSIQQIEKGIQFREFENQPEGSYWSREKDKKAGNANLYAYYIHWTNRHSFLAEPIDVHLVRCVKK